MELSDRGLQAGAQGRAAADLAGGEPVRAIGVISGTSMDGIDVALVETDGFRRVRAMAGGTYPYPAELRRALLDVLADPDRAEHDPLPALEAGVTESHGDAIAALLAEFAVDPAGIAVIGLHGQTILHRPERRFTRQLGNGAEIANRFGIPTVDRFRHADVEAGGEGAPLVPLYHQALASGLAQPLMVLNLGGVANVTYLDGDVILAFDTGPASALLDDFVRRRLGLPFDADGRLAGSGHPDHEVLAALLKHAFFDRPPPKSLDRNAFHAAAGMIEPLSDADAAATLAAFTVEATAAALRHVPRPPVRWLVGGGGRHNARFMELFRARLGVPVDPVEAVGWNGDYLEAEAFAYLAVRAARGQPLSLPSTTGVPSPMRGGRLHRPARG